MMTLAILVVLLVPVNDHYDDVHAYDVGDGASDGNGNACKCDRGYAGGDRDDEDKYNDNQDDDGHDGGDDS